MARLTRQELLEKDSFMVLVEKIRQFFVDYRKQLLRSLAFIGVVLIFFLGFLYYSARQEENSRNELALALEIYRTPVTKDIAGSPPGGNNASFATSTEKYQKALEQLQGIASRHKTRSAGKIATYYVGLCLSELKRTEGAIIQLKSLSQEESDYGALALAALAKVYRDSGDLEAETKTYQQLVDRDALTTPSETTAMHLARLYELQKNQKRAIEIYEKVIRDFPSSEFSSEAEQRLKKISP